MSNILVTSLIISPISLLVLLALFVSCSSHSPVLLLFSLILFLLLLFLFF